MLGHGALGEFALVESGMVSAPGAAIIAHPRVGAKFTGQSELEGEDATPTLRGSVTIPRR